MAETSEGRALGYTDRMGGIYDRAKDKLVAVDWNCLLSDSSTSVS